MAGDAGLEPAHTGVKVPCLHQLGESPTGVGFTGRPPKTKGLRLLSLTDKDALSL